MQTVGLDLDLLYKVTGSVYKGVSKSRSHDQNILMQVPPPFKHVDNTDARGELTS